DHFRRGDKRVRLELDVLNDWRELLIGSFLGIGSNTFTGIRQISARRGVGFLELFLVFGAEWLGVARLSRWLRFALHTQTRADRIGDISRLVNLDILGNRNVLIRGRHELVSVRTLTAGEAFEPRHLLFGGHAVEIGELVRGRYHALSSSTPRPPPGDRAGLIPSLSRVQIRHPVAGTRGASRSARDPQTRRCYQSRLRPRWSRAKRP